GIVFTQLVWTSANVSGLAPRYQASGTTTAVLDHTPLKSKYPDQSDISTYSGPETAPPSAVRRAGQWDDWSTRLSARKSSHPPALSSSASSPPPVTVRKRPANPATSAPSASIQQLAQPLQQQPQLTPPSTAAPLTRGPMYPQTTSLPTTAVLRPPRVIVRKRLVSRPLGPNANLFPPKTLRPVPQRIPNAGAYSRSTLYAPANVMSPQDNSRDHAMSPTLENCAPYQRPPKNIHSTFFDSIPPRASEAPVTISIPYQAPQRHNSPHISNNNHRFGEVGPVLQSSFHERHVEQLPAPNHPSLARPPSSLVTNPPQRAALTGLTLPAQHHKVPLPPPSVPPSRFSPPPTFQRSPQPAIARPQERGIESYSGGAAEDRGRNYAKRPPPADEADNFFSSSEDHHGTRPTRDSFEDIRQNMEREPYRQPTGRRRPLFTLPKPIDFGLSKMDQKGCKTTVKEVKHVPKEALGGAETDLHSLFRHKRGAPEESKMTSIIMTKECFFPEDPGSEKENSNHRLQSHVDSTNPASYAAPVKDYLKSHDPQTRSTQNTPTYDSFYPRPRHNIRPLGPALSETAEYDKNKFQTFSFSPQHFEGSFANFPSFDSPQDSSSKRYTERQGGLRGSATAFGGRPGKDRGRYRGDGRPWYRDNQKDHYQRDYSEERYHGPRYENEPSREREGGYGRGSRPLASGTHSKRRGPPPPKTTSRSFAFYRRDENPKKDRFVESYSTANKKSFRSDYDSDRDGFF
ncbi:unnamed protein product, partial [Ixodes persulcatus]